MIKHLAKSVLRPFWTPLRTRMESIADQRIARSGCQRDQLDAVSRKADALEQILTVQIERLGYVRRSTFVPDPGLAPSAPDSPFMAFSNCQANDFHHPRYAQLCKLIAHRPHFHRKQWEWIFVLHHLLAEGALRPGARGLGFGVGTEPLPAAFAALGVDVTATDAPMDVQHAQAWHESNQHSDDVAQLLHPEVAPDALVRARVRHQACDMNHIDPTLVDFDFNWSSCCFEHLGSLEHGLQFVLNAVEKTLRIGGVAVHTTEFNASSNDATVTDGDTVIYRLRDMQELVARLRERGHEVQPFVIGPTAHALDYHVDVPPYAHDIHLKLLLAGYVTTSVGVVVRRGR